MFDRGSKYASADGLQQSAQNNSQTCLLCSGNFLFYLPIFKVNAGK